MSKTFKDIVNSFQPIQLPDYTSHMSVIAKAMSQQSEFQKAALRSIANISQFQEGLFDQLSWITKLQSSNSAISKLLESQNSIAALASKNIAPSPLASYFESLNRIQSIDFSWIASKLEADYASMAFTEYDLLEEVDEEPESSIIIPKIETIQQTIQSVYRDNSILFDIDPRRFEGLVAELLQSQGYQVELTKQTRDGGYDLLAIYQTDYQEFKMLVECKRYAQQRKVGIDIVRSFCDVINTEQANKGLIVTTSTFTSGVKDRASEKGYLLDLADGRDILEWTRRYLKLI